MNIYNSDEDGSSEGVKIENGENDDKKNDGKGEIEDLLRLVYFTSMFDVKSSSEFNQIMSTRSHERHCCLTYDYVTADDSDAMLQEHDFDMICMMGFLVIHRRVSSTFSHQNVLQRCLELAKFWLEKSDQPIDPNNNTVTYAGLKEKLQKISGLQYVKITLEIKVTVEDTRNYPTQVSVPGKRIYLSSIYQGLQYDPLSLAQVEQSPGKACAKVKESASETRPLKCIVYSTGLVVKELYLGNNPNGKQVAFGKKITMWYTGMFENGEIFDANTGMEPFKFRHGAKEVLPGWDIGVRGMRVGDKRRLKIPPSMGYGAKGAFSVIPPNSWLIFDVELLDVS